MMTETRLHRMRVELADGAGNAPPDWYLLKLIAEEDERRALPLPEMLPPPKPNGVKPQHIGHWLEWIRTLVPCAVLCVQLVILYRQ